MHRTYLFIEEFLDVGFPPVFLDAFGLDGQPLVSLAQQLDDARRLAHRPVVRRAVVLRQTCVNTARSISSQALHTRSLVTIVVRGTHKISKHFNTANYMHTTQRHISLYRL